MLKPPATPIAMLDCLRGVFTTRSGGIVCYLTISKPVGGDVSGIAERLKSKHLKEERNRK